MTLKNRRLNICKNFAKKEYSKSNSLFTESQPKFASRNSEKKIVEEFYCHTAQWAEKG